MNGLPKIWIASNRDRVQGNPKVSQFQGRKKSKSHLLHLSQKRHQITCNTVKKIFFSDPFDELCIFYRNHIRHFMPPYGGKVPSDANNMMIPSNCSLCLKTNKWCCGYGLVRISILKNYEIFQVWSVENNIINTTKTLSFVES